MSGVMPLTVSAPSTQPKQKAPEPVCRRTIIRFVVQSSVPNIVTYSVQFAN
jgi:hypothetical protein